MATKDTKGQSSQAKADANEATQKVIRDSESREEERKRVIEESQEPDLVEGQQTGGTHDAVTEADVHVEPKKAAAVHGVKPAEVVERHSQPANFRQPVDYASKAELEVPAKDPYEGLDGMHLFIRKAEDEAQMRGTGVVVTEISYPGAPEGIYDGRDAGIRLRDGGEGVKFSDGTGSGSMEQAEKDDNGQSDR